MQLKSFQIIISFIIIGLCSIVLFAYGRTAFATLSDRPGHTGSLHQYYQVSSIAFGIYNLVIALFSFWIIILHIKGLTTNTRSTLKRACWLFLVLAVLLVIAEIYLQMRFKGKG